MAWIAVNKNGDETLFENKPERNEDKGCWEAIYDNALYKPTGFIELPKGFINKSFRCKLTWNNEAVEIKYETNNIFGYEDFIYRNLRPCIVTRGEILYGSTNKQR